MKKLLVVIGFMLLGATFAAQAHVPIGIIAGTVLDSHGTPVAGAAVTIQTSDGTQPYATHTDSTGHFQIARIETGQYDLRASHNGLTSDWTKRIMVRPNKTTSVTLRLPPAQP